MRRLTLKKRIEEREKALADATKEQDKARLRGLIEILKGRLAKIDSIDGAPQGEGD